MKVIEKASVVKKDEDQSVPNKKENEEDKNEEAKKKDAIETDMTYVNTYMQDIFNRIQTDKACLQYVLDNVSQPLYKDPLMILSHL